MSKMQRDKGKRFEREVVNTLKESGFFSAKRIPLSGLQEGFKGDILLKRNETSKEVEPLFIVKAVSEMLASKSKA